MSAYHQAEDKHSSCGALHNENTATCESNVDETEADETKTDETEVRVSWTPEAEVWSRASSYHPVGS